MSCHVSHPTQTKLWCAAALVILSAFSPSAVVSEMPYESFAH